MAFDVCDLLKTEESLCFASFVRAGETEEANLFIRAKEAGNRDATIQFFHGIKTFISFSCHCFCRHLVVSG